MKYINIKKKSLIGCVILINFILLLNIKSLDNFCNDKSVIMGITDIFSYCSKASIISIFIIPTVVFFFQNEIGNYSVNIIIRKSRSSIWQKEIVKSIIFSLINSSVSTIMLLVVGLLMKLPFNTWNQNNSLYFYIVHEKLSISGIKIIFGYLIYMFLCFVVTTSIIILSDWVFDNKTYGWILIFIISIADSFGHLDIFYKRFSIYYSDWKNQNIYFGFIIPLLWFLIIMVIGVINEKRKDFYK